MFTLAGTRVEEKSEHGHAAVVKDQVTGAEMGDPSAALTVPSIRAVYVVPPARFALGVSVAVLDDESYEIVAPAAAPPFGVTVNELVVSVVTSTAREKVAVTVVERATEVAEFAGKVEFTVSGGGGALVVKVHVNGPASVVPSEAAIVPARRAVYCVEYASGAEGVRVAVFVPEA